VGAALDKDPAILAVLTRLWSRLGADAFIVADHWEGDLCAVGIASPCDPRVLVYISCYGEADGRFNYELEVPPPRGDDSLYRVAGRGFGVPFSELVDIVTHHLKRA
jgi:hypothetical protein